MHTHVVAMALMGLGCDPTWSDDGFGRMVALLQESDVRRVEEFLSFVGEGIPREKIVSLVMFARDNRWRTLAARALTRLPDAKLTELEMAIYCESDARSEAWYAYAAREDLTRESLERSARQFPEPYRTHAGVELTRRFPDS